MSANKLKPLAFRIEQLALYPTDPQLARDFLTQLGAGEWANDLVHARGEVFSQPTRNAAELSFEYNLMRGASELEVLNYTSGPNWMDVRDADPHRVSHLGMHCTEEELVRWREKFAALGVPVAQEVVTDTHTNPVIAGKRRYNYVIFDTYSILGVDLKFIVRLPAADTDEEES